MQNLLTFVRRKAKTIMKRTLNIISRAVEMYDFAPSMESTLADILGEAENIIIDNLDDVDRVAECIRSRHYDHIVWVDGDYTYEADGQFVNFQPRDNTYYRFDSEKREFVKIPWYEATDGDYILMDKVFDADGRYTALVAER